MRNILAYVSNGNANFCVKCGAKLRPVCNCWVLKKDNYTCGEDSCPGYRMLVKLAKQKNKDKLLSLQIQ